ncbi:MAG: hydrogenase nickel incorporation protein HypB [Armatimonadetes bacterium]|nr:hydrogenase nickel incorporation protein HypB [Armatimonadota bacterium]
MESSSNARVLAVGKAILEKNDGLASRLREEFKRQGIFVLNVVSSPGSGKTELLAKTLRLLTSQIKVGVIVGDLATNHDAERLSGHGAEVLQIETDGYCHLEANMIQSAADQLGVVGLDLLIIENVGNLVCPASHDLGEDIRVTLLSVTEGEDKPLKYPTIFKSSQAVVITKTDLATAVEFDRELAITNISSVTPQAKILETSARTGAGIEAWAEFLLTAQKAKIG